MKKLKMIIIVSFFSILMLNYIYAYEVLQGPTELRFWNKEKAFNGYTLFAAHGTTYLIDMEGNVVNIWRAGTNPRFLANGNILDASKDDPSKFQGFQELDWNGKVVWQYVEKRENYAPHHDFVRIFNKKLNAWTTLYIANKTVTRQQAISAGCDPKNAPPEMNNDQSDEDKGSPWGGRGGRQNREAAQMDAVVEVDMQGNVIWEWWFFDHVIQDIDAGKANYTGEGKTIADYPGRLNINMPGKPLKGDWLHCNSMDYNEKLDQIVINSVQGEFYVIDHGNTFIPNNPAKSIELAAGKAGDFLYRFGDPARYKQGDPPSILANWNKSTSGHKQIGGSHDVQWIDYGLPGEGHFMVFNNGQYLFEATPQSYVYEIDGFRDADGKSAGLYVNPPDAGYYIMEFPKDTHKEKKKVSNQVVWMYNSKNNHGFFSHIGASAQRLPNGNTLICSDTEGHLFEVTKEGELVWEYISPVTKEHGIVTIMPDSYPMVNSLFRAYRYAPGHPALKGKTLTPKGPITKVGIAPRKPQQDGGKGQGDGNRKQGGGKARSQDKQ